MIGSIHDEPLYGELTEQVLHSGQCMVFVGSGLSVEQYLTWPVLICRLCKACGVADPEAALDADADDLMRMADAAYEQDRESYYRVLDDVFGRGVTGTRVAYGLLLRLPFAGYVTTNFDPSLEWESRIPERGIQRVYALPSLKAAGLAERSVFYIHGHLRDDRPAADHDIVLRQSEFDLHYGEESLLPGFLRELLSYHPILFIGTSLREPELNRIFEICRRIRKRIETKYSESAPPRYILLPMVFRIEEADGVRRLVRDVRAESDEDRLFGEMDIKVVRYDRKDERYSGIEDILQEWCALSPRKIESGF